MSKILFIRHGQASFFSKNYDQLSELGFKQTAVLGEYFKKNGITFSKVYAGSLLRQQQSAQSCLDGMGQTIEINTLPGLNEHQGPKIARVYYPEKYAQGKVRTDVPRKEQIRQFYKSYFELSGPWVREELDPERLQEVEPWATFKERFNKATEQILSECPEGGTVAVFTSGGPVGAALGRALSLSEEATLRIGWQVKNASFSEYLYSRGKFTLSTFNETPHLDTDELRTMV